MVKKTYTTGVSESRVDKKKWSPYLKGTKHYKIEELKPGQEVYYDVYPLGINFKGVVKEDKELLKENNYPSEKGLIIQTTGESKEHMEKHKIADWIPAEDTEDIRNKKRKLNPDAVHEGGH